MRTSTAMWVVSAVLLWALVQDLRGADSRTVGWLRDVADAAPW